jgi:hypothetical protein
MNDARQGRVDRKECEMVRPAAMAILLVVAGSIGAQESPLHLIQVADFSVKDKTITIHEILTRTVEETHSYIVDVGGKPENRTRLVTKSVKMVVPKQISLAGIPGYEPSGKKLTDEEIWRKIKSSEVIVTVQHGLPSTPYLNVLHPEALILVFPAPKPEPPQYGGMPPSK